VLFGPGPFSISPGPAHIGQQTTHDTTVAHSRWTPHPSPAPSRCAARDSCSQVWSPVAPPPLHSMHQPDPPSPPSATVLAPLVSSLFVSVAAAGAVFIQFFHPARHTRALLHFTPLKSARPQHRTPLAPSSTHSSDSTTGAPRVEVVATRATSFGELRPLCPSSLI
jgi:hypothetical protein